MTAFAVIVLMTMYAPRLCSRSAALYTLLASIAVLVLWMLVPAVRILPTSSTPNGLSAPSPSEESAS